MSSDAIKSSADWTQTSSAKDAKQFLLYLTIWNMRAFKELEES